MDRRILHLDIDAFLASVEQLRDPSLRGRPVAVGTGVVASRSYEAKAQGVTTAMPLHEALRRCPSLVVRAGDARLAERYRQRVAEVLRTFAPVVEICSLDDFYADLTGVPLRVTQALADATVNEAEQSLRPLCEDLRAAVRDATGLSVAQGLGSTRTVARLATTRAKPGGICEVPTGHEQDFLADFAVRDVPGIGPKTAEQLATFGIATVRELWVVDRELLRRTFGARGEDIYWRCRGQDDAPVRDTPALQSISRETSLEVVGDDALQQHDLVRAMASYLVDRAAAELRRSQRLCRTIAVRIRHSDGHTGETRRTYEPPSDRTDELAQRARLLLDELLQRRVLVRLVGVTLQNLVPRTAVQAGLFDQRERARGKLFHAVDAVRARHGFGALLLGESAALLGHVPHGPHGFRLRTPSLTK
jgi:DNA polymerase-4